MAAGSCTGCPELDTFVTLGVEQCKYLGEAVFLSIPVLPWSATYEHVSLICWHLALHSLPREATGKEGHHTVQCQ